MNITLEKIDDLRKRANVSYKEAKEALEKSEGNMIDAIILLEDENKTVYDRAKNENYRRKHQERMNERHEKTKSTVDEFSDSFKKLLKNLNETRVIMYNSTRSILNVSLTVTILAAAFIFPLTVAIFIIGLITGNKFKIVRRDNKASKVNDVLKKAAKMTKDVADNLKEKIKVEIEDDEPENSTEE